MSKPKNPGLANLIIAGVNKAGSTSLFHYLSAHPDISGSRDKETCYFLPLLYNEKMAPISHYEAQFAHCQNQKYRMEATPAYVFGGEKIATEIRNTLGDIKILIILKDPVQRLISFYQRKKATFQLPADMDFNTYVEKCLSKTDHELDQHENQIFTGIYLGQYHRFLEPWIQVYGKNLKLVFFDDLRQNSRAFMTDIAEWLEIDSSFYDTFEFDIKNKSLNYKNRGMHRIAVTANNLGQRFWRSNPHLKKKLLGVYYKLNGTSFRKNEFQPDTIEMLYRYFEPHNQKLAAMLNKYGYNHLPEWLEPANVKELA